jgi:hypothetical protein
VAYLALAFLVVAACTSPPEAQPSAGRSPSPSPSPAPSPTPTAAAPSAFVPAANAKLPRTAGSLARAIRLASASARRSISAWLEDDPSARARPPRKFVLQVLYRQRMYRSLARAPRLARRVADRLGRPLARSLSRNVRAGTRLVSLVTPVKPDELFDTQRPEPPRLLLRFYRRAQKRFDVDWEVLAAINFVETRFGRIRSSSVAGAQGPMQFIPSTWEAYGMGGDVHDPKDAVMGAANYLSASGAPANYQAALYAYNPAQEYVDAIWTYAREIMRDPRNYYIYYAYQVFMLTTEGDVRLTGPGT